MDRQMKTVTATGSFVSMFALSFLAVFREGAETILFYVGSFHGLRPLISILGNRACHSRSHHHCSGDDQG